MSKKDLTSYQKNVCEEIPKPPPIKKFCPACKPNPNYIEPDWTKRIADPYFNEKTCEYMVTVTMNKNAKSVSLNPQSSEVLSFRDPGESRDALLRTFIQPALILMLRKQGKVIADQILCAHHNGPTLAGKGPEELLESYDDFKTVYRYLKEEPLVDNIKDTLNVYMFGPKKPKERPCRDLNLTAFSNFVNEPGEPIELTEMIYKIKNEMPSVTNPYALELHAYVKEFFIEPGMPLKVLVAIPGFMIDSVPNAPATKDMQKEASNILSEVEIDVSTLFGQVARLSFALLTYGKYQSHFYQTQNGFVVFKTPGSCSDGLTNNEIECNDKGENWSPETYKDYYASNYSSKIKDFYKALKELGKANGFNFRSEIPSVVRKNADKIKIKFDQSDPNNPYKILSIRAKSLGCPYEGFIKSMELLEPFQNDPTLMNYIAKLKQIDVALNAKKSYPWMDFLMKYTYPPLSISYGNLNNKAVEDTAGSCVAENALSFSIDLKDYVLDNILSVLEVFQYTYSSVACSTLYDNSQEPEEVEFQKSYQPNARQAGKLAKENSLQESDENNKNDKTRQSEIARLNKEKQDLKDDMAAQKNNLYNAEVDFRRANSKYKKARGGAGIEYAEPLTGDLWDLLQERKAAAQKVKTVRDAIQVLNKKQRKVKKELIDLASISKEQKKEARKAGRKARKKARQEAIGNHPYVEKARELAYEKIATQDNLLTTLYNFDQYQEEGLSGLKRNSLKDDKTFEDVFKRMSLCNAKSLTTMAMRCLFSGVTEEDALSKIIRATLSAMDVDVFGIFVKNLPPDKQVELRSKLEKEFANIPLPWEEGYDTGTFGPYATWQTTPAKRRENKEERINNKLSKLDPDNVLVQAWFKLEEDLKSADSKIEQYETAEALNLVSLLKMDEELEMAGVMVYTDYSSGADQVLDDATTGRQLELDYLEAKGDHIVEGTAGADTPSYNSDKMKSDYEALVRERDALRADNEVANEEIAKLKEEKLSLNSQKDKIDKEIDKLVGKETKLLSKLSELTEEEKLAAAEALKKESRASIGGDPDNPASPGTYGAALGNAQGLITDAYIEWVMEIMDVQEIYAILDRFPGSEVVGAILNDFGCATQGMFKPPLKSFMSTLALDTCGGPAAAFTLPSIDKIPNFTVGGALTLRMKKLFVNKLEKLITEIMKRLLLKMFEVIDGALCKTIHAAGKGISNIFSPDGLDDAMREAFCPDGDDNDLKDTQDNLFSAAGLGDEAYDCLYKVMNSMLSKQEYTALLVTNPSAMNPETLRKIAEAVNAFCPEFSDVFGTSDMVSDIFGKTQKFIPPDLKDLLQNQILPGEETPLYDAICLTQEEYDQWNRDREKLLTDQGLDFATAKEMVDKANDRVLDDLSTLADMIAKGPSGMVKDAIDDLMNEVTDPDCKDANQGGLVLLEDEEEKEDKSELFKGFFEMLEKGFYQDLISRPRAVFNNILKDTNNARLTGHELRVNMPIIFPNYVNSDPDWEFRKENGNLMYTWRMAEDRIRGQFPETVGLLVKEQLEKNTFEYNSAAGVPNITMTFENASADTDTDYSFELQYEVLREEGDRKEIVVNQTTYNVLSSEMLSQLDLSSIGDGKLEEPGEEIVIDNLSVDYSRYHNFDYDTYKQEDTFQSRIFLSLLEDKVQGSINDNGSLANKFSEINSKILNFTRDSVTKNASGDLPNGFKYGYDIQEKITYADLLYVDPDSDPNDPSTWDYTHDNEEKILGKSATENPRVHFLDPKVHGGSYKRPFKYIEPATYNGWMGLIKTFIPEVKECDKNTGFLDVPNLSKRSKDVEGNIPFDERLSYVKYCRLEPPYDKIAAPATHGIMEGVVLATTRIYATEFVLRSLSVFCSVEFSNKNLDDTYVANIMADLETQLSDQTNRWNIIQGYVYYLLFLEQAVQTVQRQIKDGLMEETPELKDAFVIINDAQRSYDPMDLKSAMDGAAIIAFGKEAINKETGELDRDGWDIPKILWKMKSLSSFKIVLSTKMKILHETKGTAEVIYRALLSKEFTQLIDKINLNLRPRPHVQNIQKYLLSKNGILFGSSLRSGEMKVEQPVLGGPSGIDYGNTLDVVRDVNTENPLAELELKVGAGNFSTPPGFSSIQEFFLAGSGDLGADVGLALLQRDGIQKASALVSDFIQEKFADSLEIGRSGIFYMERYLRVRTKTGQIQVYNIKEFQELLRGGLVPDMDQKISDVFGNAIVGSDDEIKGTIGIKFGVRLVYSPPGEFDYEIPSGRQKERTYKFADDPVKIKFEQSFYDMIEDLPTLIKDQVSALEEKLEISVPSITRAIPIVIFEQDVMDKKISEIDLDDENFGEDLKCYVDNLTELEDYKILFDFCFPVRSYVSLFGVYCYYAFFESLGKAEGETAKNPAGAANDRWKSKVFKKSKKTLRELFNSTYRTDDEAKQERKGRDKDKYAKFLTNILPGAYLNLDWSSIKFWQAFRIVDVNPFDADGNDCKNGFQKLFD